MQGVSGKYHRAIAMRPNLEGPHVSLLGLKSSTGKPNEQLDGSADASDASSTAGEVLAQSSTAK